MADAFDRDGRRGAGRHRLTTDDVPPCPVLSCNAFLGCGRDDGAAFRGRFVDDRIWAQPHLLNKTCDDRCRVC